MVESTFLLKSVARATRGVVVGHKFQPKIRLFDAGQDEESQSFSSFFLFMNFKRLPHVGDL